MTDQIHKIWKKRKEVSVSGQNLVSNFIPHITADPETIPTPHLVQNVSCQKLSIDENPMDSGKRDHPPTVAVKEWPVRERLKANPIQDEIR